jgi:hypothetical protein
VNRHKKAWRTLLADVKARSLVARSRADGRDPVPSGGVGYEPEGRVQLRGRGRSWLLGQYHGGSTLGGTPSEYRSRFFLEKG